METIKNFLKLFIVILIIYVGYLYYTRPEMEISPDTFKYKVENKGYVVSKVKSKVADNAFQAVDKTTGNKINYLEFSNEKEANDFYLKFINNRQSKHEAKFRYDIRIKKSTGKMQLFIDQYRYYGVIRAKNVVIYSDVLYYSKKEIAEMFEYLYEPPRFELF